MYKQWGIYIAFATPWKSKDHTARPVIVLKDSGDTGSIPILLCGSDGLTTHDGETMLKSAWYKSNPQYKINPYLLTNPTGLNKNTFANIAYITTLPYYDIKSKPIGMLSNQDIQFLANYFNINESLNEDLYNQELFEAKQDIENFKNKFGEKTYDDFLKAKDRLKNNDISIDLTYHIKNTSPEEMSKMLQSLYNKSTDKQRLRQLKGEDKEIRGKYKYFGEIGGYKVYQPLDHISSMDLGVNTGWCTTGRYGHAGRPDYTPSAKDAKKHWNEYKEAGVNLYYFLNPKTMYGEWAVAIYPKVLNIDEIYGNYYINKTNCEIFDSKDNLDYSKFDTIKNILNKIGIEIKITYEETEKGLFIKDGILVKASKDIKSIMIPNSVTSIGDSVFYNCTSLTSITIPDSVTSIGYEAFYNCSSLTSITIPSSVTSISEATFSGCSSLTSITIPNSVTSIGDDVFTWCSSLTSINVDCDNPKYLSIDGVLFEKMNDISTKLIRYPEEKDNIKYIVPNSVTSIGNYAFEDCSNLTSVTIPNSVKKIGDGVFWGCSKLTVKTNNKYVQKYCDKKKIKWKQIHTNESLLLEDQDEIYETEEEVDIPYDDIFDDFLEESMAEIISEYLYDYGGGYIAFNYNYDIYGNTLHISDIEWDNESYYRNDMDEPEDNSFTESIEVDIDTIFPDWIYEAIYERINNYLFKYFNNKYDNTVTDINDIDFTINSNIIKVTCTITKDQPKMVELEDVNMNEDRKQNKLKNDIVKVYCYYEFTEMPRKKAIEEFQQAAAACEGSEKERYTNILMDLLAGEKICFDSDDDYNNYHSFGILPRGLSKPINKDDFDEALNEKIVKKGSKYQVQSEKGRNMGTYNTKADAEERLKQVEMFKHMNEDTSKCFIEYGNDPDDIMRTKKMSYEKALSLINQYKENYNFAEIVWPDADTEYEYMNEDVESGGYTINMDDIEDTLGMYLQWEGIIGYDDDILSFKGDREGLENFLEEEGIYGYTDSIYDILEGEDAYCSEMEESDFIQLCDELGIDPFKNNIKEEIKEQLNEALSPTQIDNDNKEFLDNILVGQSVIYRNFKYTPEQKGEWRVTRSAGLYDTTVKEKTSIIDTVETSITNCFFNSYKILSVSYDNHMEEWKFPMTVADLISYLIKSHNVRHSNYKQLKLNGDYYFIKHTSLLSKFVEFIMREKGDNVTATQINDSLNDLCTKFRRDKYAVKTLDLSDNVVEWFKDNCRKIKAILPNNKEKIKAFQSEFPNAPFKINKGQWDWALQMDLRKDVDFSTMPKEIADIEQNDPMHEGNQQSALNKENKTFNGTAYIWTLCKEYPEFFTFE